MKRKKKNRSNRKPLLRSATSARSGYISEEEAERRGLPREYLETLAGHSVRMPDRADDRQLRRRVLLRFWAEGCQCPLWPCPTNSIGEALLPTDLTDELAASMTSDHRTRMSERKRGRLIVLWCWGQLLEEVSDQADIWNALFADVSAGPPSQSEIDAEYRRFYGDTTAGLVPAMN